MSRPRLALVSNFRAEASPSMLLCGDQLFDTLQRERPDLAVERIQPEYTRVATRAPRLPLLHRLAGGADKMLNRYWLYPRHLRQRRQGFDAFHICDHSYASLVHALPAERCGILCHDVDVFRSVLQPELYRRSPRFNAMQRHALAGLARAAIVFHTTEAVRMDILRYGLVPEERLVQVPLGVDAGFRPADPSAPAPPEVTALVGERPFLLNVSVSLPRKRLDVLLRCFALVRQRHPELLLVRVGPDWPSDLRQLIADLDLADGIRRIPRLEQSDLVAFYQRARAVVMTSEAEGFGMPLIEALASGAMPVVSDIPVFHEVAGDAAIYCPVGVPEAWAQRLSALLADPAGGPPAALRAERVRRYTWSAHAALIADTYRRRIFEPLGLPAASPAGGDGER